MRVRSNGITKQFGGRRFARIGKTLSEILQDYAGLKKESKVLEIGCGCGRVALALTNILDDNNYFGVDIESVSLDACKKNMELTKKSFQFDLLDVSNNEYNPKGKYSASSYKFPYIDKSFDVVFLISVFTHMIPSDVSNYIREICRMIKNNGHCLFSAFLVDYGTTGYDISFPFKKDGYYYCNELLPEVAIGYDLQFFITEFEKHEMILKHKLLGTWRGDKDIYSISGFSQDILVFSKK